jgi:hypothetical protein
MTPSWMRSARPSGKEILGQACNSAILQFSPGLVSWKHEKVEIAELQA